MIVIPLRARLHVYSSTHLALPFGVFPRARTMLCEDGMLQPTFQQAAQNRRYPLKWIPNIARWLALDHHDLIYRSIHAVSAKLDRRLTRIFMAKQQNNNNVPLTRRPQSGALVGWGHRVRHLAVVTLLCLEIRAYLVGEHLQHFLLHV